jgi:hypothetical protein
MFEPVYTVTDYYDGPRAGIADCGGAPHDYRSEWDEREEDFEETYTLTPIDAETFVLALEAWSIWLGWEDSYHRGLASLDSHPALPRDRARHDELRELLATRLVANQGNSFRRRAEFRVVEGSQPRWPGVCAELEVRWSEPSLAHKADDAPRAITS